MNRPWLRVKRLWPVDILQHTGILHVHPDAALRVSLHYRPRPFITLQPGKRRPEITAEQHRMALPPGMPRQDYRCRTGLACKQA